MVNVAMMSLLRAFNDGLSNANSSRMARSAVAVLLVIATGILLGPKAEAQELPLMQLDMPILPDGIVTAPSPVPQTVGNPTVGAPTLVGQPYTAQPISINDPPAVPLGASVSPQVMQTNFVGCTSCGSVGCSGCNEYAGPGFSCPPSSIGLWGRADYLIWYEKEAEVIPLATTSSGFGADPGELLALSAIETEVLFGGDVGDNPLDGLRLELGAWLDAGHTFGIMGRYFEVGDRLAEFSADQNDFGFLGIPFINTDIGSGGGAGIGPGEDALELTVPSERNGQIAIAISGDVRNWEVLFRRFSEGGGNYRRDWLYGYRNFSFDETLTLNASTILTNPPPGSIISAGAVSTFQDQFDVENRFHGLDLGMTGHFHQGPWSMDYMAKFALGVMTSEVDINGSVTNTIPAATVGGLPSTSQLIGGLFSQESNIGSHDESNFVVIPELNLNVGYGVTPNLDLTFGYTFIWVSSVARAGAMDRAIDEGLFFDLDPLNGDQPRPTVDTDTYYIHGINLGITGRF